MWMYHRHLVEVTFNSPEVGIGDIDGHRFRQADFWFLSLGPPCELEDSLADSFGELDVVGFSECRKDGWAQPELELECFAARERAGGGFKHVERAPVVGQALDIKRHDGNAGFAGCYGSARVPWPVHVCLKIAVGGARRENAEDRLLPPKDPRVLEELDHGVGGQTLLNRENDKLCKGAPLFQDLRAHQHAVIGVLVDVVAGEDHGPRRGKMFEAVNLDTLVQRELVEPDECEGRPALRPHLPRAGFQGDRQEAHPRRCHQAENGQGASGCFACNCFRHYLSRV